MREYVVDQNDFKEPCIWDLKGLHWRENVSTWRVMTGIDPATPYIEIRCNACGKLAVFRPTWYCDNCGAMMVNTNHVTDLFEKYVELTVSGTEDGNATAG